MAIAQGDVRGAGAVLETPGPGPWKSFRWLRRWNTPDRIAAAKQMADEYGDVSRLDPGFIQFFSVLSPDAIQECLVTRHRSFKKDRFYDFLRLILGNGLLTSEDEFHLKQRRMIQPAFHKDRIAAYAKAMVQYSDATRTGWKDGQTVNMASEMMALALSIVGKTLFGSEVGGEAAMVAESLENIVSLENRGTGLLGIKVFKLPLPSHRRFFKSLAAIDTLLYRMIQEHRAQGDTGDLLSMLLAAQDEDNGQRMTDQQVRDEAITLFLAGHETTAIAMTWTWYVLSQNPDVEARLHAELDSVLGGRLPSAEDYPKLDYTRRVFQESMRMFPPVYMVSREATEETSLGGYRVPKGAIVVMSPYLTHHDPRNFPDPERFDPDRWLPGNCAGRHKFAYFPFGGGRRLCAGEAFAWMEGVLVMATLCQQWRASLVPGHQIGFDLYVTLRPKGGMPMVLHRR